MDYQAYAYLQMAQDQKAKAVLDRLGRTCRAKLDDPNVGAVAPRLPVAGVYARNAVAARYALERGAWGRSGGAAAAAPRRSRTPMRSLHFARAIGAARSGKPADASADIEKLAALRDALKAAKDAYWAEHVDIQRQNRDRVDRVRGGPEGRRHQPDARGCGC